MKQRKYCFLLLAHSLDALPYTRNRVNFNVAGPSLMTISIEIERGFYGLILASASFSTSYRHATFPIVVAVLVGFSVLRSDSPVCGEIAKTTWGFRFSRNWGRLSPCPIRFYSHLAPTWTNASLRARKGEFIFHEEYKFQRNSWFRSCVRTAIRNVARIIIAEVGPNGA